MRSTFVAIVATTVAAATTPTFATAARVRSR
jgi:hypothetical protein